MGISASDILSGCCFYPLDGTVEASEATLRAVISRTYYSTYHTVKPHVENLPVVKTSIKSGHVGHREAYRRLHRWDHPNSDVKKNLRHAARIAALALLKSIEARERADYDLSLTITDKDCQLQISRLEAIKIFVGRCSAA